MCKVFGRGSQWDGRWEIDWVSMTHNAGTQSSAAVGDGMKACGTKKRWRGDAAPIRCAVSAVKGFACARTPACAQPTQSLHEEWVMRRPEIALMLACLPGRRGQHTHTHTHTCPPVSEAALGEYQHDDCDQGRGGRKHKEQASIWTGPRLKAARDAEGRAEGGGADGR